METNSIVSGRQAVLSVNRMPSHQSAPANTADRIIRMPLRLLLLLLPQAHNGFNLNCADARLAA